MNKYQEALNYIRDYQQMLDKFYDLAVDCSDKPRQEASDYYDVLQDLINRYQNLINAINIIKKDTNISCQDDDKWDWLMEYLESEKEKEWIER